MFPTDQTTLHTAATHNGRSDGKSLGANKRSERRLGPRPSSPEAHLQALPAPILLNRLPIPMSGTGLDGVVVYTNPAFATLLGHHPDTITLTGKRLPELLAGPPATSPGDVSPSCAAPVWWSSIGSTPKGSRYAP